MCARETRAMVRMSEHARLGHRRSMARVNPVGKRVSGKQSLVAGPGGGRLGDLSGRHAVAVKPKARAADSDWN